MDDHEVTRVLTRIADEGIPGDPDVWPGIEAELNHASRAPRVQRWTTPERARSAMLTIRPIAALLLMVLLLGGLMLASNAAIQGPGATGHILVDGPVGTARLKGAWQLANWEVTTQADQTLADWIAGVAIAVAAISVVGGVWLMRRLRRRR